MDKKNQDVVLFKLSICNEKHGSRIDREYLEKLAEKNHVEDTIALVYERMGWEIG